jgi:hypothetical protein
MKMIEVITGNIWIVVTLWIALGAYMLWYFFGAKTIQPLSLDALAITWKVHKKQTGCSASHVNTILVKKNTVVGFKCECGYKYMQKRLIAQKMSPEVKTNILPKLSNKITNIVEAERSLKKMGVNFSSIRKV